MLDPAAQASLNLETGRENRFLFSDYYLSNLLPATEEWRQAPLSASQARIRSLWEREAASLAQAPEASLESNLIRPILAELGWNAYENRPSVMFGRLRYEPDYAFFASDEQRRGALERSAGQPGFFRDCIAIADAKRFGASLDRRQGPEENPTAQLCRYLYSARVRWGFVTNGIDWRLCHRDRSSDLATYYQVDLRTLLGTFPIVRQQDETRSGGRVVTRDLVVGYYNAYTAGDMDVWLRQRPGA